MTLDFSSDTLVRRIGSLRQGKRALILLRPSLATIVMISVLNLIEAFGQTPPWTVRGEAIVTCPCRVPCPCRSNAPPSQPHCENLSYVRVVQGSYGTVKLDRLQYVWAADECAGPKGARKPTTLYFAPSATARQIDAVERIMAGEHCAGKKAADMRSSVAPLVAGVEGSLYSVRIPGQVEMDVDVAPGPLPMEPLPALDLWGNSVSYARNITARINDPAAHLKWDYSGLQANYRTFEANSSMIENGWMLGLYRDDTGRFNEAHRSLIHELHLEVPLGRDEFKQMLDQVRLPARPVPATVKPDASGWVAGTVLDPGGKLRSGARLLLKPAAKGPTQITLTNPQGRYFVAHVPPGAYQLCASTWDGKALMRGCAQITVKSQQALSQALRLAPALDSITH